MDVVSVYEPLRAGEKSKPIPNLADSNYSHIGRTQPEYASPDIICSIRIRVRHVIYNYYIQSATSITLIHEPHACRMTTMFWVEMRLPCVPVSIFLIHVNRCMAILMR